MKKTELDIITEAIESHLTESGSGDFDCKDCDEHGKRPTDSNLEIEHRRARVKEFEGLNHLPFYSPEQRKRFEVLKKLRVRDNKHAFNQGRRKKLPLDESEQVHLGEDEAWDNAKHGVVLDEPTQSDNARALRMILKSKRPGSTAKKLKALKHPHIDTSHLDQAMRVDDEKVQLAALNHPKATDHHRMLGLGSEYVNVTLAAANHPKTTVQQIKRALDDHGPYRKGAYTLELTDALKKKLN